MPSRDHSVTATVPCHYIDANSKSTDSRNLPFPSTQRSSYTHSELLAYAKCFVADDNCKKSTWLEWLLSLPSVIIRYGVIFPIRLSTLSASTVAFFVSLPVAVMLQNKSMVSVLVKYYCKGILFSLGTVPTYYGEKPKLKVPHVFVANHTSYLDYILVSADQFPHAVVMARHTGALGFLQNNGLNFLHSMTFDRSDSSERQSLAKRLKKHVMNPTTWPNPMLIFPEGTCVNNKYTIRFQKGAFELRVRVIPIGIKYGRTWGDPYWDTRKGFLNYAFYRMTRWITPVDIVYCSPQDPLPHEDAADFGSRVKKLISEAVGLESEEFNGMAKRQLLEIMPDAQSNSV